MRFLRRSLVGLFLLSLTLGLLAAAGLKFKATIEARQAAESRPQMARERQFAVNVVQVEPSRIVPVLSTYGEVGARRTLELRVPSGGRVVELSEAFEEGGRVTKGDVILRIDPTEAEAAVEVAKANLMEAEADRDDAARTLELAADDLAAARAQLDLRVAARERQQNLSDRGVGTASAVEAAALAEASAAQAVLSKRQALANAEAAGETAVTSVLRAQLALAEAERALADTVLTAGFDGVLTGPSASLGALLGNNELVATLIAPDELEVAFRVSTEQYSRLVGATGRLAPLDVTVSLDVAELDLTATGRITRESASVSEGQTGRLLFARLDETEGLRPGDFVTVRIHEPALDQVAFLPATAVDAAGTILVVDEESRLILAQAPVLRRQGDEVIVAAADLAGKNIVSERSPLLGEGIRVRINSGASGPAPTANAPQAGGETIKLDEERRARLIAYVEGNARMPEDARARLKEQLAADEVPADLVTRLEDRMGS